MYRVKRFSNLCEQLFSKLGNVRDARLDIEPILVTHICMFMQSSKSYQGNNHWEKEIVTFINEALSGYKGSDLKILLKDSEDIFEKFHTDIDSVIDIIKSKYEEENKQLTSKLVFSEEFVRSNLFNNILVRISVGIKSIAKSNKGLSMKCSSEIKNLINSVRDDYYIELGKYRK